jgi:hypothetical protein
VVVEVVKVALEQVLVEQVDKEEQTDSAVHRVEQWVVTVIPTVMSVADQGTILLVEAAVAAVTTLDSVVETLVVIVMVLLVEVEVHLGFLLHTTSVVP